MQVVSAPTQVVHIPVAAREFQPGWGPQGRASSARAVGAAPGAGPVAGSGVDGLANRAEAAMWAGWAV